MMLEISASKRSNGKTGVLNMNYMQSLKGKIRVLSKSLLRNMLQIIKLPVQKNKVLFYSGLRGYTCNPKYVCEYLRENYKGDYKLYWIGKSNEAVSDVIFISSNPLSLFYHLATSKVFVTCGENTICPKDKRRLIVCTWHGVPYKTAGYDTKDALTHKDASHSSVDLFISCSNDYTKKLIFSAFRYHGRILNCGYPRNDIFFNCKKIEAAQKKVREYYHITNKTLLFAPTYRGEYRAARRIDGSIDFNRIKIALKKRYGEEYTVLVRMHYLDNNNYEYPDDVIDVSNWEDMQEILCCTDILITDYSSVIWDYSLTKRPCLLFLPDLKEYSTERGLTSDPCTWPGIVCTSMDQLYNSLISINESECKEKADQYLKMTGSYEDGSASRQICMAIENFTKE